MTTEPRSIVVPIFGNRTKPSKAKKNWINKGEPQKRKTHRDDTKRITANRLSRPSDKQTANQKPYSTAFGKADL